jgi:hypothetical protein
LHAITWIWYTEATTTKIISITTLISNKIKFTWIWNKYEYIVFSLRYFTILGVFIQIRSW